MEEDCLIRIVPNLNCNVCENRKNLKIDVEDLSLLGYGLLKARTKIADFDIGKNVHNHKTQFLTEISNNYRRCADPLKSHKML